MNKRQKLVQQQFLNNEEEVIKQLGAIYGDALTEIEDKIENLTFKIGELQQEYDWLDPDDPERAKVKSMIQSKIYQKNYQEQLRGQVDGILNQMQVSEFVSVSDYLDTCYEDGFIGTIFDAHGQGVPFITPIDQEAMVRAVQLDSKISKGLYTRLGEDVTALKKVITAEVSRSIATGKTFEQTALQLKKRSQIGYNNAVRIARTEGHRIQCTATMDAMTSAKEKGADVVKQWDAALDARTRASHVRLDGEIRDIDKKFSNGLMFPGDPSGGAAEVVNCRCALLQRARAALDRPFSKYNGFTGQIEEFDSPQQYDEFKKAYMSVANKSYMNYVSQMEEKYHTKDFAKVLDKMTDQEYNHYSKLLVNNPVYNKDVLANADIMALDEAVKITKKSGEKIYSSVNAELVNSKQYHDKFVGLTGHKSVDESIYQESMRMLEHRDGTPYEDMVLIDSRTGKFVTGNMSSNKEGHTGLTKQQYLKVKEHNGDMIIIHNHPNSSRISYKDIFTMYEHKNISAIVAVGHDGSVQIVTDLNRKVDIDKLWENMYNDSVNSYGDKAVAEHHATTMLYELGVFKTESR